MSFLTNGLRVVADSASLWLKGGSAVFQIPIGFSLALLGAGYLVSILGGLAILLGIFLTWGVAVPYFAAFSMPIDADIASYAIEIWKTKVRFIGVNTIGTAAIWTLLILMKPLLQGMAQSFRTLKDPSYRSTDKTELDLSPKTMIYIVIASVWRCFQLHNFVEQAPISSTTAVLLITVCTLLSVFIGFLLLLPVVIWLD